MVPAAALALLLLTGCSDDPSQVDPSTLAEGGCQELAEPLTAVGALVERLRDGLPDDDAEAVEAADTDADTAQEALRAVRDAEAELPGGAGQAVSDLANDLGVLRVAVATAQVGDPVLDQVDGGRQEVLDACATS